MAREEGAWWSVFEVGKEKGRHVVCVFVVCVLCVVCVCARACVVCVVCVCVVVCVCSEGASGSTCV